MFYKGINLNNILWDYQSGDRWSASSRAYDLFGSSLFDGITVSISDIDWCQAIYNDKYPNEVYLIQAVDFDDSDWMEAKRLVKDTIEVKQRASIRNEIISAKEEDQDKIRNQESLIRALESCNGQVTMACRTAKIPKSKYLFWVETDKIFRDRVVEVRDRVLDDVSFTLIQNAKDGDIHSIKYFMDANAKDRGYGNGGNKQDNLISDESVDLNRLSIEEQQQLLTLIEKAKPNIKQIG
jgi:hypothetical protein